MWQVYRLTCKITGKSYIGKGNGKSRWTAHKRNAAKGVITHLCNAIRKYGVENFVLSIEGEFELQHEAYAFESMIIDEEDLTHQGYNEAKGMKLHVDHDRVNVVRSITTRNWWTIERRKQLSDRYKGSNNPFFGKKHNDDTKKQMSLATSLNKDSHKKISHALMGHIVTDATKLKMSESSPTKGKTLEEAYGVDRAIEIKQRIQKMCPDRRGENHPRTKLKTIDVIDIRQRSIDSKTDNMLAIEYNVSVRTIYKIRRKETWKHL